MDQKKYNTSKAVVATAFKIIDGEPYDLRQLLADLTDIPEDRLDAATAEITLGLTPVKMVVNLIKAGEKDPERRREIITAFFGSSFWVDDDKGDLTIKAYLEDNKALEEIEEDPLFEVKTKLATFAPESEND